MGWFSSGADDEGQAFDLLDAVHQDAQRGRLPFRIEYVFCDRESSENPTSDQFLGAVSGTGLNLLTLSSKQFPSSHPRKSDAWRRAYDLEVLRHIVPYEVDLIVFAGYMRIVSSLLYGVYPIINLHPATPDGPEGTYEEVIERLIETHAPETGVMIHLVTGKLDKGPVISQCRFSLARLWESKPTEEEAKSFIRGEQVARELPLLIRTLELLCEQRLSISEKLEINGSTHPTEGWLLDIQPKH